MVDSDQLENDPFFRLPAASDWNACIGKQGTEENYLDGYIEAAMELVNFLYALVKALRRLGRPSLADRLSTM